MRGLAATAALVATMIGGVARAQDAAPAEPEASAEPEPVVEVEVRAPPPRAASGSAEIRGEDAKKMPGTQGDAVKAIQNLPAAARSAFGSGQLVVWGSAPEDTRTYIDGIEVPSLYHFGGIRGLVGSYWVRKIELLPGGFGAEYGRALGGVAEVETISLPDDGVHGAVAADLLDASAAVTVAATASARMGGGGRYGYASHLLDALGAASFRDYVAVPTYHDAIVKGAVRLGEGEEIGVVGIYAGDELERAVPAADPALRKREVRSRYTQRIGLRYRSATADGATTVLPWLGFDATSLRSDLGESTASRSARATHFALRAEHERTVVERGDATGLAPGLRIRFGLDALATRTRTERDGSLTVPPREGDVYLFGQPPGDESSSDTWTSHLVDIAPYVSAVLAFGPFTVTPGLRMNGTILDVSRRTPRVSVTPALGATRFEPTLDPRLALRADVDERLAYDVAAGLYHQPPSPDDLSSVFGTPTLGPAQAVHVTAGQSARLHETTTLEVTGFYKALDGLAVRIPAPSPPLAHVLSPGGKGRSYGVNWLLRQSTFWGFSGFVGYALTRADRWAPWTRERLFDFDQTHVLTVVGNQEVAGFTFGTRLRVATGMPRTPIAGAFYNARGDRYEPVFGDQNTIRLPTFFQLDVRAEKAFRVGPTELTVYVDVQNVTNHANAEEITYAYDFRDTRYITGLPVVAVAGASLEL